MNTPVSVLLCHPAELPKFQLLSRYPGKTLRNHPAARIGFQTAPPAAAAQIPLPVNAYMTQLTGKSAEIPVNLPVCYNSGTNSIGNACKQKVLHISAISVVLLRQCRTVILTVKKDRKTVPLLQHRDNFYIPHSVKIGRIENCSFPGIYGSQRTDPNPVKSLFPGRFKYCFNVPV